MKKLLFLFFLMLPIVTIAQTKLYTPKELKEDADYYFSTLYWVHPNPYYFYKKNKFNKIKNSIYSNLNKPLSNFDFIQTIAPINSLLDTHSTIPFQNLVAEVAEKWLLDKMKIAVVPLLYPPKEQRNKLSCPIDSTYRISSLQNLTTIESFNKFLEEKKIKKDDVLKSILLLPPVEVRGNKLFFSSDSINNITEVNGILAQTIVSESKKYINEKLSPQTNSIIINSFINAMLLCKYDISPPFRIKFETTSMVQILEGMEKIEWNNELASLMEFTELPEPYMYEIYPANSVAIFHMSTFENKYKEDFLEQLKEFKEKANEQHIKFIFYDLSMNGGGNHMGNEALSIIKHDTVYSKFTRSWKIEIENKIKIKQEKIIEVASLPNDHEIDIPNDRILFVVQSPYTTSGADYFCRIVAENKLGILVGEPTGELTKTFSFAKEYTMPNTHISFNIATTLVDFSDFFDSLTTPPDIYWDLKNPNKFTEQGLLNIINYYKTQKKGCIN